VYFQLLQVYFLPVVYISVISLWKVWLSAFSLSAVNQRLSTGGLDSWVECSLLYALLFYFNLLSQHFSLISLKRKLKLMRSPLCPSVRPSLCFPYKVSNQIDFSRDVRPLKVSRRHNFSCRSCNHHKMADVKTSGVDAKLSSVNVTP
jgi:hypothetical protein